MWIEGKLVDLTCMLMQSDKLYAGTIQVVQDDFAVSNSSGNMRAELAMRPLDVLDAQAFTLTCMRVAIAECGSPQVGLVDNLGAIDTHCLEDLLASKHGMRPLAVDVESSNVKPGLVSGIKRTAGSNAARTSLVYGVRSSERRSIISPDGMWQVQGGQMVQLTTNEASGSIGKGPTGSSQTRQRVTVRKQRQRFRTEQGANAHEGGGTTNGNKRTRAASGLAGSEARRPHSHDVPAHSAAAKHRRPTARAGRRNAQSTSGSLFWAAAVEAAVGSRAGGQQSLYGSLCLRLRVGVEHAGGQVQV